MGLVAEDMFYRVLATLHDLAYREANTGAFRMEWTRGEDHVLLLDEMEKQGGVLSPRAVIKYFPAVRTFINALPKDLW